MLCKECGNQLTIEDNFCPNCGSKVEKQKVSVKNILIMVLVLLIVGSVFTLSSYTISKKVYVSKNAAQIIKEQNSEIKGLAEKYEFIAAIEPHMEILNSCHEGDFGAQIGEWCVPYFELVDEDEDSFIDSSLITFREAELVGVVPQEKTEEYERSHPTTYQRGNDCYMHVENFETVDDLKKNLKKYVTEGLVEYWVDEYSFCEFEGELYKVSDVNYSSLDAYDLVTYTVDKENESKYYVTVDFLSYAVPDHKETVEFTRTDNGWIISDVKYKTEGEVYSNLAD